MKCLICKNGTIQDAKTTYFAKLEHCYIIIENVPCMKCEQCGEEFIDGVTLLKIENIIEKLKSMITKIAVVDFRTAV